VESVGKFECFRDSVVTSLGSSEGRACSPRPTQGCSTARVALQVGVLSMACPSALRSKADSKRMVKLEDSSPVDLGS
jgi:hypothetical protein